MPYIGNTIRAADDYRLIDDISSSFNGSTTSFALQVAGSAPVPFPKSPQQVLISVNGVIQEPDPTGSSGFNLVGTNIVFSSAPTNGHAFFGIIYATADYLNSGGNFPSGSTGSPSLTFIGDEDTGIYRKGSGSVGFVSNSTEIANTDSNGLTISSGNIILGDSSGASDDRIKLGASADFQIYHSGSQSRIEDTAHPVFIRGNQVHLQSANGNMISCYQDAQTELFHNEVKRLETTSTGITVTGVCTATSFAGDGSSLSGINTDLVSDTSPQLGGALDTNGKNISFGDGSSDANVNRLTFGAGSDLVIFHAPENSFIQENGSGNLKIQASNLILADANGTNFFQGINDGAVELFHNGSKKFETSSTGASVTGTLQVGTTSTPDYDGVKIYKDSGNIFFQVSMNGDSTAGTLIGRSGSKNFRLQQTEAAPMEFWTNNTKRINLTSGGNFEPETDNSINLGSSTKRWANIYTADLKLSNEGSSNDVDGTWGNYTIQEGAEDLFLINKRNGKKYKFNLTEVS